MGRAASHLIFAEIKNKSVVLNCDSQSAIMALDNTKITSKTTHDAALALNKLGENNQVLIRWLAAIWTMKNKGDNKTDAALLKLPIPKATWEVAIRDRTKHNMDLMDRYTSVPVSHFTMLWRKKFSKSIHNL